MSLHDLIRDLRRTPLTYLGPVAWKGADEIERLLLVIGEFVAAQEQYDREGGTPDSVARLRDAKQTLWKEARRG